MLTSCDCEVNDPFSSDRQPLALTMAQTEGRKLFSKCSVPCIVRRWLKEQVTIRGPNVSIKRGFKENKNFPDLSDFFAVREVP